MEEFKRMQQNLNRLICSAFGIPARLLGRPNSRLASIEEVNRFLERLAGGNRRKEEDETVLSNNIQDDMESLGSYTVDGHLMMLALKGLLRSYRGWAVKLEANLAKALEQRDQAQVALKNLYRRIREENDANANRTK